MAEISDKDKQRTEKQERSLARQKKSRAEGKSRRAAKKAEKEELAGASSTKERREIKEKFEGIQEFIEEGAIFNVDTGELSTNQGSLKETINDDGIDSLGELQDINQYQELSVIICVDGSPVSGSILFKTT